MRRTNGKIKGKKRYGQLRTITPTSKVKDTSLATGIRRRLRL